MYYLFASLVLYSVAAGLGLAIALVISKLIGFLT